MFHIWKCSLENVQAISKSADREHAVEHVGGWPKLLQCHDAGADAEDV